MYYSIIYHTKPKFFEGDLDKNLNSTIYLFSYSLANKIAKCFTDDYDVCTPDEVLEYLFDRKKKMNLKQFIVFKTYKDYEDYVYVIDRLK
jgi:hypothetical protein